MQISFSRLSTKNFIYMTKEQSKDSAKGFFPKRKSLSAFRKAADDCQACDLWERGTQTVFGNGARQAEVLFVGEQPGNEEDLTGEPFVGPAGKLLDRALEKAGIDRQKAYVTNIVKHFKWEPRGKRRIHKRPNAKEIAACRPWLEAEIALVKPKVIVCLGATASQALLGSKFRVSRERGKFIESALGPFILATVHPSAILRAPDDETRHEEMRRFIDDLKQVAALLSKS
jgi:DNA polymerase